MKNSIFVLFLMIAAGLSAQNYSIKGKITDDKNTPLPGAHVSLQHPWGEVYKAEATEADGSFTLTGIGKGGYKIEVTYLGFDSFTQEVTVTGANVNLGTLKLAQGALILGEVEVKERIPMASQKGDTTQFNANAFKVMKDASAGDLIEKIPTVSVEGGKVQAQGEDVKQILVDGKPFFGTDPTAALRNLPAEVIEKVQIFDQASDQAQFTGFNDGNTSKTMNIVTRPGMRVGQFGKLYAGYGYEDKYQAGGNINVFSGNRRISFIGMSNNINVQNFSSDDLLGVMGGGGGGGRGGFGGGGGGGRGGFGGGGDFLVQQQGGISTTHAFGINYSDKWWKKVDVSGSYFVNKGLTDSETSRNREFVDTGENPEIYTENSITSSSNVNHRFNMRLEVEIDSFNSFTMRPRLSWQLNDGASATFGQTMQALSLLNQTDNTYASDLSGLNFSNTLTLRHKFKRPQRTFSVDVTSGYSPKNGDSKLLSANSYYIPEERFDNLDQESTLDVNNWNVSSNFAWTEPVSKNGQLMLNYQASWQQEESDKSAFDYNEATSKYDILNEQLTNIFSNDYFTQQGGIGYNYNKGKDLTLTTRATYQWSKLINDPKIPEGPEFSHTYNTILPFAMLRLNLSPTNNIRIFYRTSTRLPSVEQLQGVLNNTNPLQLRVGNPDLDQNYEQNLFLRYQAANPEKSTVFFAMLGGGFTNDYIANSTYYSSSDNPILDEYDVPRGAQITRPVNLDGYWNARSFVTYGVPIKPIKSNFNLNLTWNYSKTPGLINDEKNFAKNNTLGLGVTLASNISDKVDFTLSTRSSMSDVKNTLQTNSNSQYLNQNSKLRFNWIVFNGFVFRTDISHQYYTGLSESFNQTYFIWNMALGKKLFKNDRGEIALAVNDLLEQNRSISRTITETYIEDTRSNDLTRFFMLTFTYNLRHFRVGSEPEAPERGNWDRMRMGH